MAKSDSRTRTVLESLSELDLSNFSSSPIRSLAQSTVSDSQTLIYLGTHSGSLLLLSINPNNLAPSIISLLRSLFVSDSSIDSIQVFGDIGKILVLSGGFLFLIDSHFSQPVKRLSFLRGVSVVTRRLRSGEGEMGSEKEREISLESASISSEDKNSNQRFLQKLGGGFRGNGLKIKEAEQHREGQNVFAVLTGKRLILIELVMVSSVAKSDQDGDVLTGSFVILKEIQCSDGIMDMVWLNDSIIVCTVNGYNLISTITGQSGMIFTLPDISISPRLKLLSKEWNVLLLVDNVGIVVNEHGQPVSGSLVFRCHPYSIGEISTYVVVVSDGKIQLYHKKSGSCIQALTFGGEGIEGPCILADEEDKSGKLFFVATPSKVCKILPRNRFKLKATILYWSLFVRRIIIDSSECSYLLLEKIL